MAKQIRVALSGSGFRLPAHIGALQAIDDAGYEVVEICGTSGGAIVAAMYASGMQIHDMINIALTYDWSKILHLDFWSGISKGGYCSGSDLLNFLMINSSKKTFSDLKMALKIVSSDLLTEKEVVFSSGNVPDMPVALAARASSSIPFVFVPVGYKNWLLVDGGCCNNIPVNHLTVDKVPRLGIYLTSEDPVIPEKYAGIVTMAERVVDMMLASNEAAHADDAAGATIVRIPTDYAGSLDTKMPRDIRQRLINDGYNLTMRSLLKKG